MDAIKADASTDVKRAGKNISRRYINVGIVFLTLLFLFFLYQIISPSIFNVKASGVDSLPVSIRAGSEANYSQDARGLMIPPIRENILNQIITEFPATGSPKDREATLQVVLSTPVPTMTPDRLLLATFTSTLLGPKPTQMVGTSTSIVYKTPFSTATVYHPPAPTVTNIYSTSTLPVITLIPTPKPTKTPKPVDPTKTSKPVEPTKTSKPTKTPKLVDPTKTPKLFKTK